MLVLVCVFRSAAAEEIFIRASQIGYGPRDAKIAIAFSKSALPMSFSVLDADTQKIAFDANARPIAGATWGQFEHHTELDFTKFSKPGRYVLRVGDAQSFLFTIGTGVYAGLPDQLLEFMRQQRCGYNPWLGTNCHQHDGRTAYGPLPAGTYVDARGGWHDAGDLLKYLITSANATAQMLLAYQLADTSSGSPSPRPSPAGRGGSNRRVEKSSGDPGFSQSTDSRSLSPGERAGVRENRPHTFSDQVNALGDAGANGVPDILDEARWGLDWLLKLHPAPDQLYHQLADDRDHAGWRLPQNESVDYGWGKGGARVLYFADGKPQGLLQYQSESTGVANIAGRYAAAMALAYQIWKDDPQHGDFAQRCLQAGKEVYELGRAKEGVQQGNSYKAPYRYEETTWADDMEWGAAELYRATRERRYLDEAKHYAQLAADEGWMGRDEARHYQFYPFMNVGHFRLYDLVDRQFKKTLAGYYRAGIERCVRAGGKNPYRIGVPFIWCSNNLVAALVTQCLMYERMTGDTRYREFTARQRDWLLGRNPWGTTMFTEIGSEFPRDTHMMTFRITGRTAPGGLVDGPVYERIFKSLKGVSITEPDPLAAFQGPAVYHDDWKDYSTNEPTMDGTASAILMFALSVR
ncbi:MAG: glycoside hydrolase family 9 protein [Verrucomicrobia bacterium]|nr:glycoside hydrolase family 9 protein [Verrucomicrobiota bacterium]